VFPQNFRAYELGGDVEAAAGSKKGTKFANWRSIRYKLRVPEDAIMKLWLETWSNEGRRPGEY